MNKELVPSLKDTIWGNIAPIAEDFIEMGLDQITENEVVKEIPIVGTVVRLGNAAIAIRDRHLLKKTLVFVSEINNGTISGEKLEKHKNELELNPKKMKRELEHILILIDRSSGIIKSIILANFYKAFMDEAIDFEWDDFCICSEMLENFSVFDIDTLKDINEKKQYCESDRFDRFSISRLSGLGLVEYFNGMLVMGKSGKNCYAVNNTVGELFFKLGIQNSIETIIKIQDEGVI